MKNWKSSFSLCLIFLLSACAPAATSAPERYQAETPTRIQALAVAATTLPPTLTASTTPTDLPPTLTFTAAPTLIPTSTSTLPSTATRTLKPILPTPTPTNTRTATRTLKPVLPTSTSTPILKPILPVNTATSAAMTAKVSISGFAFKPGSLTVKVGTTVTWTNEDSDDHTTDGSWGSGSLGKGASYSHSFTKAGSFGYVCAFHPAMNGKIEVQP
jgi:plastocyanin